MTVWPGRIRTRLTPSILYQLIRAVIPMIPTPIIDRIKPGERTTIDVYSESLIPFTSVPIITVTGLSGRVKSPMTRMIKATRYDIMNIMRFCMLCPSGPYCVNFMSIHIRAK